MWFVSEVECASFCRGRPASAFSPAHPMAILMPFVVSHCRISLFALLLLLCAAGVQSQEPIPSPPTLDVKGYLLIEHNSRKLLGESNADERLEPASLTKIMTAYVVFREIAEGNLTLDETVLISEKAWKMEGSRTYVEVNKRVPVEVLLQGMIIQSGNDASVALAERVAGSEETFAQLMNAHAKRLGMSGSHFMNSTGLPDPDHYTTARDIATVTSAIIREFPEFYRWYGQQEFTYNNITQPNRNGLLRKDAAVDGVKTGWTRRAGYCLVSSAVRGDQRLISVVLGAPSKKARERDSLALLNWGARFYETHRLFKSDEPLERLRIWGGERKELPVAPATDLYVTVPRGRYAGVAARIEKVGPLEAPVRAGQRLGEVVVELDGEEIERMPLVALETVEVGGLLQQATDSVLRLF